MTTTNRPQLLEDLLGHMSAFRRLRARSFCDHPTGRDISLPQLHVLILLSDLGTTTVSGLAHLLEASLPSVSALLDRMEERGLIGRTRQDTDRRVVTVEMSAKGRELAEEFMGFKRDQAMRIVDAMTDEELRRLVEGLEALRQTLDRLEAEKTEAVPA